MVRNLTWCDRTQVGDAISFGVASAQVARAAVHIDGPHGGVGGAARHGQGDGPGPSPEVE